MKQAGQRTGHITLAIHLRLSALYRGALCLLSEPIAIASIALMPYFHQLRRICAPSMRLEIVQRITHDHLLLSLEWIFGLYARDISITTCHYTHLSSDQLLKLKMNSN